ncbi:ParB N-terminal domain-containing protein [Maritimibacter sp. UBA3975]|uniref:ParB/RepB/Spo0J family partition protein n=1 Tax=Maritimibacter sp. UBA3975 TaxID=1946833 RepID=UPI000C09B2B6|nr:ParB N-terminal domain-containing protein [Maritimibacter sp. UBA3975]MAM61340.1 chromosome partitioning protein ParB [Maritimibacter sp.]|tara:strand:+ start:2663 stop:3742 length:1080 start_codon:yes stop_codon:yes gene_type:complete
MAKRRKLEAPSAADLTALEAEFRRETSPKGPLSAPIAQVAADTAQAADLRSAEEKAEIARNRSDAERLREAEGAGRLIAEIPLTDIDEGALIRDRMSMDGEELEELKRSIAAHGLRLPIEVFERQDPVDGKRYGLLSGYRRFMAVQGLHDLWDGDRYETIRAVVRDPGAMGGTFVAMVEENEVRADLSHFERGRISVLAAQEGAFLNTEAAVDALFATGSKAKRSKIRSFALIFEELGDMLVYPESLREKDGLKLATALRAGGESSIRDALAEAAPQTPEEELAALLAAIEAMTPAPVDAGRGGRPKRAATRSRTTDAGFRVDVEQDGADWVLRLSGERVTAGLMRTIADEVEALLSRE